MKSIYDTIYDLTDYKQFGEMYDISILNNGEVLKLKYSMLDFVNYYNDKEYIDNIRKDADSDDNKTKDDEHDNPKPNVLKSEFNVFPHSDPGLFALSFSSTNEGLEMYDHVTKNWIPIGLNEGIWWNGKTANIIDDKIKSGEHRVKIDNKTFKSRFTGWYEVSCNKQLKPEVMKEALDLVKDDDVNKMSESILAGLDSLESLGGASNISKTMSMDDITDEFNFVITDSKSNATKSKKPAKLKSTTPKYDPFMTNNNNNTEFNFGVPNSKNDHSSVFNEFNFGVPMSKSMPPPMMTQQKPPSQGYFNKMIFGNEYSSGVPKSKSWAPLNVNLNNNFNNNNNMKTINKSKKSKKRNNEYNFGVPMSKSGF